MTFAYTITVDDPNHVADDTVLTNNLKASLDAWGVYLGGSGTVDVRLGVQPSLTGAVAEGGSQTAVAVGAAGALTVYQDGAANELATGVDPNGATADGVINLNSATLPQVFFSATPGSPAPAGQLDGLHLLEQELGHILGANGFRDASGVLNSDVESTWDQLLTFNGSTAAFTGARATAVYGGPVPVTTTANASLSDYHFANSSADQAATDLLSGVVAPGASSASISPLDVAALADVGTPLSATGALDVGAAILLRQKSFADFSAATTTAISTLSAQVSAGATTAAGAQAALVPLAASTTAVATLSYEFFTQKTPTLAGLDYLVSPEGPDANNLNSAYYARFNTENRFINFAVNLGTTGGAGAAAFSAAAASLTLSQVVTNAYTEIFGTAPSADKVSTILNAQVSNGLGGTETRAQYFASYGVTDIGTKAATVGWLLSQAEVSDIGTYAHANDTLLVSLAGAVTTGLGTDIVASHSWIA